MSNEIFSYRALRRRALEFYKKLKAVDCRALSGKIVFTRLGFDHLIQKKNKIRPVREQMERFALLECVEKVLTAPELRILYREKQSQYTLCFWALIAKIDGRHIKVVVIKAENGEKKFLSIMDHHYQNKKSPR